MGRATHPGGTEGPPQREYERLQFIQGQIRELEAERVEAICRSASPELEMVGQLLRLKGIGLNGAWVNTMEFFVWRDFHNGKEVGGSAGLNPPTPYQSREGSRERGMSKAGNRRCGRWRSRSAVSHRRAAGSRGTNGGGWLRYQPESELT